MIATCDRCLENEAINSTGSKLENVQTLNIAKWCHAIAFSCKVLLTKAIYFSLLIINDTSCALGDEWLLEKVVNYMNWPCTMSKGEVGAITMDYQGNECDMTSIWAPFSLVPVKKMLHMPNLLNTSSPSRKQWGEN